MCNLFKLIKTAFIRWANNPTSYDGKLLKQYNDNFKRTVETWEISYKLNRNSQFKNN